MEPRQFYDMVEDDDELTWLGAKEVDGEVMVYVRSKTTNRTMSVSVSGIREREWDELRDVLCGRRASKVLEWWSRVVGFFSQVANWNKSKRAELIDRQKGDYGIGAKPNFSKFGSSPPRAGAG